jgi:cell division protein FtsQ
MRHLPLVTGTGANTEAAALIDALAKVPDLQLRVRGSARVGDRRWTLYLDNGVKILLPEGQVDRALMLASQMDASQKILSRAITSLDLRLVDRVVIAPLPGVNDQAAFNAGKQN